MVIDGKVYLGDEDGDVTVLAADKTLKVIAESNMGSSVYSTPVPAHGTLFIVNRNQLYALAVRGVAVTGVGGLARRRPTSRTRDNRHPLVIRASRCAR